MGITIGSTDIVFGRSSLNNHGFTTEAVFTDFTTQSGSPIDVPKQVKYGVANTSPNGIISVDTAGNVTILKSGPMFIKSRIRIGRTGASGYSDVFVWVEVSINGGASWAVFGNSVDVRLNNASEVEVFFDMSPVALPVGTILRSMFARSSTGDNSGDLVPASPSTTLATYGVPVAPSAQLTVYRSVSYNY